MATLYTTVHYYLVDHPIISQYEWNPGQTPGASPFFLSTAVVTYLTLTLLLHHFPILPTLPSAALCLTSAAHNALLCFLSLVMAVGCTLSVLHQTPPTNLSWCICFPASTTPRGPTFFWGHVFYFSKILEFGDTLLILLSRSRSRRLSFLHVYHHAMVLVMCYLWLAAPQTLFPVGLVTNSAVHVLMYSYYLLAALGFRPRWKKLVTDCQITQFLFGHLISGLMLYLHFTGSGCSGLGAWGFSTLFMASLLILFINFHIKNYAKKMRFGDDQVDFFKNKRL
ncbi:Fatty acyl-CoA elongase/Polyunsaturated fatty acid specific elongation enzyme [Handroanthus impetiginosus]|uniref:very-long-chain 3-oxoacyl-CoA synthase n=1 Tax=Handroanthus impetiginosus TaxID=429701 RepID=A0A2G9HCJ4_9LAMI|nr:Fatty acyl-CoA elongase/Polyunsaturated fatty acid specific elongation enzyme [Handroanthus impetiginosus]